MEPLDPDARWTVVVPVKDRRRAKSRLAAAFGTHRSELAVAFALDTLGAVRDAAAVGPMIVVTDDPSPLVGLPSGVTVVDDPSRGSDLDTAVRAGLSASGRGPIAIVAGDLPQLSPHELDDALARAAGHDLAFVADADGTGTTLLAARHTHLLTPAFGPGSAHRHRALGFADLGDPGWPGLRRDVDEPAHVAALRGAATTGPRTAALLDRLAEDLRAG